MMKICVSLFLLTVLCISYSTEKFSGDQGRGAMPLKRARIKCTICLGVSYLDQKKLSLFTQAVRNVVRWKCARITKFS